MNDKNLSYDIIRELFNISVGKAADMLSDIVNQKILLSVPCIKLLKISSETSDDIIPAKINGTLMVSSISFRDDFTGKAVLIFPAEKMKKFIGLCMHDDEMEYNDTEFNNVDFDVIKEIGNIILNCIIGEIGNFLHTNFKYSLPEVKVFNRSDFNNDLKNSEYSHILVLYITFIISDSEIEGAIIVDLSLSSLQEILSRIQQIEDTLYE